MGQELRHVGACLWDSGVLSHLTKTPSSGSCVVPDSRDEVTSDEKSCAATTPFPLQHFSIPGPTSQHSGCSVEYTWHALPKLGSRVGT